MASSRDINKLFRKLFRELLNMPEDSIRPSKQVAPTGNQSEQFATVYIVSAVGTNWAQKKMTNDAAPSTDIIETLTKDVLVTLSVQFFRGDAYDQAARLCMQLQSDAGVVKANAIGAGLVRMSPIRDMSELVNTFWETRAQVDIDFYINVQVANRIATYGRAPISTTIDSFTTIEEVILP